MLGAVEVGVVDESELRKVKFSFGVDHLRHALEVHGVALVANCGRWMGGRWVEDGWKMGGRWVEDGWKMGGRWVKDGWKMGGRWVEDGWKMGGRWVEDGWKMNGK